MADAKWGTALNMVMRMEPKAFAAEVTRMQWEIFLDIRVSARTPQSWITTETAFSQEMFSGMLLERKSVVPSASRSTFSSTYPDGHYVLPHDLSRSD